ncbi:membrane bound O-acyl transferase family-domain-containing protein [Cyathus striatus]|nr:membrane bound O-acyl transferase family-domain-containing protein [Cyathus striatus]
MRGFPSDALVLKPLNVPAFHIYIHTLFFLGLLSRSRLTRACLFIFILVSSIYVLFYRSIPKEDTSTLPFVFQTVLRASDALVITEAIKLKRVGQREETNQLGIWDKAKWAFDFLFNLRQIGWVDEPRHILPPHPTESRWQFVRSRIIACLWYLAITDFAQTVLGYIPIDAWRETSITGIGTRMLCTALSASMIWSMLTIVYTVLSTIVVGLGLSDASAWPPSFGKLSDAYTIRRFWGRTWHQLLRRALSAHGDFVAYRILHLQKDSFIGTNVHRYVAFTLSGVLHAAGDYGVLRSKFREHHASLWFFFLQAVAIMFEQAIGNILGLKAGKWTRRAGYVWTFCWFTLTLLPWVDPQARFAHGGYRVGIWNKGSMTNFLWTGKWSYEAL